MAAIPRRSAARLVAAAVCAVLVGGCGGQAAPSTAASTPATSTIGPTATTLPQLTAKEVAWLDAVATLPAKMDGAYDQIPTNLTAAAAAPLARAADKLRACSRELRRIGAPSDRLRPIDALVRKACARYDKGARCFDTAAGLLPITSNAEAARLQQAVDCGYHASGGVRTLVEAATKADATKAKMGMG